MGSEIMTTTVEQRVQATTNPGELNPSSSRPIEQTSPAPSTAIPSKPIQQSSAMTTATDGAGGEYSKPIEQKEGDTFNEDGTSPDDCFIEQKGASRNTEASPDTPIEQQEYVTSNLRDSPPDTSQVVEQRFLSRDSTGDEPIEQEAQKSNTIDLTQFDFAELIFPPCNSIKNPITTNILWRVKDYGFPFDIETLIFTVNGLQVQDSSNFTVTAIANGLQLDYDPPEPFDYGSTVTVILNISDNADPPNDFFYRCLWDTVEDSRPPIISLISPVCGATGVGPVEPVVFSVLDAGDGVDQESIRLSIEGITVCDDLTFDPTTTASGTGYIVTWTHDDAPFRYESNVSVFIEAADLSEFANSTLFVCAFDTEESSIPEFMNWSPAQCATFVDNVTGLTFEVYGNVDGVDISSLEVRIDNKLRKVYVRPRVLRSE